MNPIDSDEVVLVENRLLLNQYRCVTEKNPKPRRRRLRCLEDDVRFHREEDHISLLYKVGVGI